MKVFKEFKILSESNEFNHSHKGSIDDLRNTNIQEESERKFDILLDGLLNGKQKEERL